MENSPAPIQKKGLSTLAKVGIGCGGVSAIAILAIVVLAVMYGGKVKQFAEEAQKNPTRAAATMMVTASAGAMEMVAEDDVTKRYTIKDKNSGSLTTIYWSETKQAPEVIQGDFSAIPAESATEPVPAGETVPGTDNK